jgi:hypothetical protein
MTPAIIAHTRLINQQLAASAYTSAKELVSWMGAMQAQDYPMVRWAIGSRLPNSTDAQVAAALDSGELLRTHLLRPTWHVVSADDIYWLLDLTAPHIKASIRARYKELELSESLFTKSHSAIEKALVNGQHLTRQEVMAELNRAGIITDNNRSAHLMLQAELDGIVCNGAMRGKQITYALLPNRVTKPSPLAREEGLAKLAYRYFTSHGPATLADFGWWSGLPAADARRGLELIKPQLFSETIDSQTYWFTGNLVTPPSDSNSVYLLPAFDEYTISYKDRSAVLPLDHQTKAISANGIFSPIVVHNGSVVGTWKRTIKKDKIHLEPSFFLQSADGVLELLDQAGARYRSFLGHKHVGHQD